MNVGITIFPKRYVVLYNLTVEFETHISYNNSEQRTFALCKKCFLVDEAVE